MGGQENDTLVHGQPHLAHRGWKGANESINVPHDIVLFVELGVLVDGQGRQPVGVILVPAQRGRIPLVNFDRLVFINFRVIRFLAFVAHKYDPLAKVGQQ